MRRIDFTDLFPEDIEVAVPGRTLLFPGDISVDDTVALTRAAEAVEQAPTLDNIERLAGLLLDQFRRRQDLEELPIPAQLLLPFVYELYLGDTDDQQDGGGDPRGADEAPGSRPTKSGGSPRPRAASRKKKRATAAR